MQVELRQRGRALIDFEVSARQKATALHKAVEAELKSKGFTADTLPDDMEERHIILEDALSDSKLYSVRALLADWCSRNHGLACAEAFEEIREEVEPQIEALALGPVTLHIDPDFAPPAYHSGVWFHRTHGGWDDADHQGFIHGELTHKKYVAKVFPGDIYEERRRALAMAPRSDYKRILEIGTSSGHYTKVISEMYPDAHVFGIDPSIKMLEQARRVGNELGLNWTLFVGLGEATTFDDASFDLVTAYSVHHEVPPRIIAGFCKEAFRILKPGGDILFADVARTAEHDRMTAWFFDWIARWQGEPYWRATCALDLGQGARDAGFTSVETFTLAPQKTHVVRATKPV